ncbi:MAG: hypothetical protein VKO21_02585 [Candidatus Sericytochromatia bacterium]|nr:hypothetical protein [Candidatus Sericytochromatia bacterium]
MFRPLRRRWLEGRGTVALPDASGLRAWRAFATWVTGGGLGVVRH